MLYRPTQFRNTAYLGNPWVSYQARILHPVCQNHFDSQSSFYRSFQCHPVSSGKPFYNEIKSD